MDRPALPKCFRRVAAVIVCSVIATLAGCGGRAESSTVSDSSTSDSSVGSTTDGPDANGCEDIEVSPAELVCSTDQDCVLVVTGPVCPGYVPSIGYKAGTLCLSGIANSSGQARIAGQIASIPHGNDAGEEFCDNAVGTPRCLGGQCTVCGPFAEGPPACFVDGSTSDASMDAAIDAAEAGGPCATTSDCPAGFGCGFLIAQGCSAHGQCLAPPSGANCASGRVECGCDGAPVYVPNCDGYDGIYGTAPVAPAWMFASDGGCIIEPPDAGADGAASED
jgi:hypothetical protein